jgi:hypothetical protein
MEAVELLNQVYCYPGHNINNNIRLYLAKQMETNE